MSSHNAIFTPESSPDLQKARRSGKRVMDLRDDGKWHDISESGAGKGDKRRSGAISTDEYAERFERTFGGSE